jgi:hypothetical protein
MLSWAVFPEAQIALFKMFNHRLRRHTVTFFFTMMQQKISKALIRLPAR